MASILFTLLVGMAFALIRPAQPIQVALSKPAFVGLDNPAIVADSNIHPARKCKLFITRSRKVLLRMARGLQPLTYFLFSTMSTGGFCIGVSLSRSRDIKL